ncbi:hypothetical protein KBY79_11825 [Synechococcus lacustris C3-12m-Tous]|uniref:hypothetical protein n=1 Tax=Synechococcus lacustris TaxID=2116544 RepID=UPI0020CCF793|nr:hypothetical protein [Synechococcus lacustris]MCP9925895.1 hypothetical protein [Synechococcus lacustris C3-12m-Tous]
MLLALLVGAPVMAVDYVKCEAIQRAYGRLSSERRETWLSIKNAKLEELCPMQAERRSDNPAVALAEMTRYGDMLTAVRICRDNNFEKGKELADKETLVYDKKIAKVKADYFAAKCP